MILRRDCFAEVIGRQLDLFVRDYPEVIEEAEARLAAYNAAERDEAEELYGDYVDAVETGTELLADMRDAYARTLPEGDDERYEREFNAAVAHRLTPLALEIETRERAPQPTSWSIASARRCSISSVQTISPTSTR